MHLSTQELVSLIFLGDLLNIFYSVKILRNRYINKRYDSDGRKVC